MAVCFSPRHLSSIWVFWLIVILLGRSKSSLSTERAWLHCLLLEDCVHTFLLDLHQNRCSLHVLYQVHRCLLHQAPDYLCSKFMTNQEFGYAHICGRDKVHIQICPKTEFGKLFREPCVTIKYHCLSASLIIYLHFAVHVRAIYFLK